MHNPIIEHSVGNATVLSLNNCCSCLAEVESKLMLFIQLDSACNFFCGRPAVLSHIRLRSAAYSDRGTITPHECECTNVSSVKEVPVQPQYQG